MEIFAFCVITFEPIEVQTRSASQNDRLAENWLEMVEKWQLGRSGRDGYNRR